MKINIIGAGVSGLCAGSYLQMNGFETQIFEKHDIPGGLCTSWKRGEYTFDGCAHWILGSDKGSSFYKMWSELLPMQEIPFHNHYERIAIDVKNTTNRYGEKVFHLYTDLDRLQAYMTDLSPADEKVIREFIKPMRVMQQFDLPPIMDDLPPLQSLVRGIKMSRYLYFFYWFMRLKNQTNMTFAKKFKDPFLRESFELLYDGYEVNLVVMMMPLSIFDKKSAGYPIGGSLAFARRLEETYLKLGGKIHYKTPVHKILTDEHDNATGVLVRHGVEHKADITISAADWHYTVFEALEGRYADQKMIDLKNAKSMEVYYSVVQLSFGIAKDLSHLPHFSRFPLPRPVLSPDGNSYDRMEVHLYHYDPTMAPAGKTAVVVSFYTLNRDFWIDMRHTDRKAYRAAKAALLEQVIPLLDERLGGIKDLIEEVDIATPATLQRYTNSWKGSAQGWLPGKNILAPSPVGFTLPKLKNFYLSSHWNQPGGGLPIAIKTGRDIAAMISKKINGKFKTKADLTCIPTNKP
jgi:phytoene dehydrogenase-like protein